MNSKLRNSRQFNNRKDQLSLQFKSRKLSKKLNQNKISELLNNKFKQLLFVRKRKKKIKK